MAIGTGILMLPFAFKEVGYGTALLSSALMTIIAIHAAITMVIKFMIENIAKIQAWPDGKLYQVY